MRAIPGRHCGWRSGWRISGTACSGRRRNTRSSVKELEDADGGGFLRESDELVRELEKIPSLVERYQKEADRLAAKLSESQSFYRERRQEIGSEAAAGLEDEMEAYETYISKDGERRRRWRL